MKKAIATILISVLAFALQAQDSARVVRVIDGDTYVLQTNQKTFTDYYLAKFNSDDLRLMRNEIFARYGYIFKTDDLNSYFNSQSWYNAQYADVTSMLTSIEKENANLIKSWEIKKNQ